MFTEKDIERAEKMNAEVWTEIDKEVKKNRILTNFDHSHMYVPEQTIAQNHINEFFFKKLAQLENQIEELRNKDAGVELK